MDAFESIDVVPPTEAIVAALARGDSQAVRRVYRMHHEQVRAFACRFLGSEPDAEEVVQEVFLALPSSIRRFKGESSLGTFIMGMAVNWSRRALRASLRRRAALNRLVLSEVGPPPSHFPDESLVRQQLATRLLEALARLSLDQRVAFVLSEVEERSSSEISEILGIPSSTVRARVNAAREKLRNALGELETEGER
jgi:RNA polymerase sigma-70 factor (ECF subfamily)